MAETCATSTLTIPARLPYAEVAAGYVEAAAGAMGFTPAQSRELAQSLLVILREILARAFEPGDAQAIQISCQHLPIGLKVIIAEQGLPLAAAEISSLAADPQVCPRLRLGDTLVCVRQPWDEASFHNLGRAGAAVELVKYFSSPGDLPACPAAPLVEPSGPVSGTPETFTVRPFSPADAQEITRVLYHTYGYSYPFENLYYPDQLVALNAEGSFHSLVAVSSQGQIVGHVALFFDPDNPALAEIGAAVVHPGFRGHGCLHQLTEAALAEARRRHLQALFIRPVTNHTYSQRASDNLGFKPCGLLVGFSPAFLSFKGIHEKLPQRESVIVAYLSLNGSSPEKIFPPPRHREVILHLYARLGLTPEAMAVTSTPISSSPGRIDLTSYANGGIAIVKVKAIGSDILGQVQHHLKQLCQSRFEVIHLHLDLTQPAAAALVPACESLGFFFAGILPGLGQTQILILQYLNNVPLDYDKILIISPQARELLEYIKSLDPNRL
jgi:RimJ/RimL family protein N-acetyltransferase